MKAQYQKIFVYLHKRKQRGEVFLYLIAFIFPSQPFNKVLSFF